MSSQLTRVTGVRFPHDIGGECADGVDGKLVVCGEVRHGVKKEGTGRGTVGTRASVGFIAIILAAPERISINI